MLSEDIAARFPALKMINWFEWDKFAPEVDANVDWTAVGDVDTGRAFRSDLPTGLVWTDEEWRKVLKWETWIIAWPIQNAGRAPLVDIFDELD